MIVDEDFWSGAVGWLGGTGAIRKDQPFLSSYNAASRPHSSPPLSCSHHARGHVHTTRSRDPGRRGGPFRRPQSEHAHWRGGALIDQIPRIVVVASSRKFWHYVGERRASSPVRYRAAARQRRRPSPAIRMRFFERSRVKGILRTFEIHIGQAEFSGFLSPRDAACRRGSHARKKRLRQRPARSFD